ncbi:MAG TPA: metallophosphoesterase [Gemmatimonadales bacterium]|nr:metallophosphoesterase [Gemmatimonadales bacterium]
MNDTVIAHFSDIHFGGQCDLPQIAVLEETVPGLRPDAIVVSGDLAQRARHGEFQAARRLLDGLGRVAPTLVIPGNHDVQWWRSPLGLCGSAPKYRKYRRYFGEDLTPTLELERAVIASALTAHGLAWGSLTLDPNDLTVKGHLPRSEIRRVRHLLAQVPPDKARILVVHHNVLPGVLSRRWGLARPRLTQRRLAALDLDLVLCGHDHTEGAGDLGGKVVVSTAGTHSVRTRGGRPSAFNLVRLDDQKIEIQHYVYDARQRLFRPGDKALFARWRAARPVAAGR